MKWKIYFLLFGLLLPLTLFTTSTKTASAIESYKISPEDDRYIISRFYENSGISESRKIDMHYYFYARNPYGEELKGIAYICDYKENRYGEEVKTKNPCGLEMIQEAGKFKIKLKAGSYFKFDYSRKTQKITRDYLYVNDSYNYESYDLESFTDEDFEKGLTLLGGSTLLKNEWNRNEGGFLIDPVGGSSQNQNNNNQNNNQNNNGGGFDILGGIKAFFQPMIDSIARTQKAVLGISDNILNGIKGFFSSLIDSVGNIWGFLSNFFVKLFEELGNFFKWLFVLDSNVSKDQIESFSSNIKRSSPELNSIFDFSKKFNNSVGGNSSCSFGVGELVISVCSVPSFLLNIARALIIFSMAWLTIDRIIKFVSVLFGTRYMWQRGGEE